MKLTKEQTEHNMQYNQSNELTITVKECIATNKTTAEEFSKNLRREYLKTRLLFLKFLYQAQNHIDVIKEVLECSNELKHHFDGLTQTNCTSINYHDGHYVLEYEWKRVGPKRMRIALDVLALNSYKVVEYELHMTGYAFVTMQLNFKRVWSPL